MVLTFGQTQFVKEFTLNIAERIINDAEAQDFKKAYGLNVKYNKIAKNLGGTLYMDGACKFRNADKSGANTAWKEAEKAMEGIQSLHDWWDADKNLLRVGVIETARTYIDMRQVEKATDLLEKYKSYFEGDKDFEAAYTELTK